MSDRQIDRPHYAYPSRAKNRQHDKVHCEAWPWSAAGDEQRLGVYEPNADNNWQCIASVARFDQPLIGIGLHVRSKIRYRCCLIMVYPTSSVFHLVDVTVVLLSLTRLRVAATACSGIEEDNSVQTCVEDLPLDVESWRMIEALCVRYEDFPTHCRYGQYVSRLGLYCTSRVC